MVPMLKAKNRRTPSIQLDYLIHIEEIKPWPPSQSLRTLRSVAIQWEHGDRNSGLTSQVIPSLGSGSGVGDGRIEFNESLRIPVTLLRELSGKDRHTFQKNCIEFNLVEPRREKNVKGQLLGTAIVDLADYGVVKETLCISAAINCKRSYRNTSQPFLFLKIKSIDKIRTNMSSKDPLMRPLSIKKNGSDSVSALMSEEYAEEAETASFTDDDVCSYSSQVESNGRSLSQNTVSGLESVKASSGGSEDVPALSLASSKESSSRTSSTDLSSDLAWLAKSTGSSIVQFSSSSGQCEVTEDDDNSNIIIPHDQVTDAVRIEVFPGVGSVTSDSTGVSSSAGPPNKVVSFVNISEKLDLVDAFYSSIENSVDHDVMVRSTKGVRRTANSNLTGNDLVNSRVSECQDKGEEREIVDLNISEKLDLVDAFYSSIENSVDHDVMVPSTKGTRKTANSNLTGNDLVNSRVSECQDKGEEREIVEERQQLTEEQPEISFSENVTWMDGSFGGASSSPNRDDKQRHFRSVRSSLNSSKSSELVNTSQCIRKDMQNGSQCSMKSDRKDNKVHIKETRSIHSDKLQHLEQRVKKLEWELTEAAAIEAALYSVVAEHGSSTNKVHAPARRLSRFYIHATKVNSQSERASAAKTAVSGLILVTKACGNDVPRLTFWLSNTIFLRAIITESLREEELPFSVHPAIGKNGNKKGNKRSPPLKWQCLSANGVKSVLSESFDDWEDPKTLGNALEKVEGWIISRIIESIWWQTLTPHMQSGAAKAIKMSGDQEQGNFSLELWKKAFRDAYERICPVRAEGHQCGCIPSLSRLIMEQCVARLDVAMFNAILRESADDIPTDPVSDPISDTQVLPIPAWKASFGAGAQLKNAIGNWSQWLSDLFGVNDDSSPEDMNTDETSDDEQNIHGTFLKSFHLLNELSDLMMLPKDMLLSRTVRKEVCPTFGPALIRRVLNIFVPDEFCPDPIPKVVLEALHSEDSFDAEENLVVNFPYPAAQIDYNPPRPACVVGMLRDGGRHSKLARSVSLLLTKSHNSDDELDVLDSPLSSIYTDNPHNSLRKKSASTSEENPSYHPTRYQLLRKIWNRSK